MVETRSMNKTDAANLTAAGVEQTPRVRVLRSPPGARPTPPATTESVSALPISTVTELVGTSSDVARPRSVKRTSDLSGAHHEGDAQTLHGTNSFCSKQSASARSRSSHSSATVRAQMLAVEAEAMRRRVERERTLARQQADRERTLARQQADRELELARLESEAEHTELQAKLAALTAKDKSSCCSYFSNRHTEKRTTTWVSEQNANMTTLAHGEIPGDALTGTLDNDQGFHLQTAVNANTVPSRALNVNNANCFKPVQAVSKQNVTMTQQALTKVDSLTQLAQAITGLSDRPKKPELVTFSGEVGQWMAFKISYDRTKSNFSPAENLTRLNNAVRGKAYQSVASLLWTSHNPEEVMNTLEQTYARPEILVAREIAELRGSSKLSSPEELNLLANKLRNFVTTVNLLKQNDYLHSPELLRCILFKLSEHTRARFTDFAATYMPIDQTVPKLELLSRFLITEADKQLKYNYVIDSTAFRSRDPTRSARFFEGKETIHTTVSDGRTTNCTYCKQGIHTIKTCKVFLTLAIDDRWRWVRESKTCYRCLKSNPHTWNNCKAKLCGVNGCSRRHNSLLHGTASVDTVGGRVQPIATTQCNNAQSPSDNPTVRVNVDDTESSVKVTNTSDFLIKTTGTWQSTSRPRGLLKTLPIVIEGPDGKFETTALLDEGSTATLIDGDVAARIGVRPTRKDRLLIEGVGGMTKVVDVGYVNFYIRGRNLPDRYLVEHARAINPLGLRVQHTNTINFMDFDHLSDLSDELSHTHACPTVLIGAPDWHLSLSREVRFGKKNEPVASKTLLGWVLHGALSVSSKPLEFVNYVCDDLDALIKSQYDIDSLGITQSTPRSTDSEKRAIDIVETSARQLDDGRFEVGLPWKKDLPSIIPDSYSQALSRFKVLERQMSKDTVFAKAYHHFIENIINKGYAEECGPETYHKRLPSNASCVNSDGTIRWYLPTFGVIHPQKKKLRVVHDAAAATKNVSLNSLLLQGPDLLCSLLDILFRFREGAVALNADIKEMFPQVKIAKGDRDAQRFLWRNKDGALIEYRMSSMIFGAVSSPFIALYIKDKNAHMFEGRYPAACRAILEDHYMDDYLGSLTKVSDAAQLAADITTVHKACGFEMRAWTSNNPNALFLIPKEFRSDASSDVYLPPNNEVGVLGVKWNPFQDSLSFRAGPCTTMTSNAMTKRSLLSSVMKVYDPLGLLMPVIIWGRILIQKLWRKGVDWDTPVPSKFVAECDDWFKQLHSTAGIRIPRWYMNKSDPIDVQLHVIADGGEQAYACVAYWRFSYDDGSVSTALIGSKARVAPLKPLSIPRLELQAALIASRFAQTILHAHRMTPSASTVTFWTDSTTVLKWIRSDARTFKAFVAHRLGEILETTNPSNWRWIPTSLNVADDATKPKRLNLTPSSRWFTGPPFLLDPPCTWPTELAIDVEETSPDSEQKSELVGMLFDVPLLDPPVPNLTRFSSWLRLLRAAARVLQGSRFFRLKLSRPIVPNSKLYINGTTSSSRLHASDIIQAEKMLFQRAQMDSFSEELKTLLATQAIPKSSRIATLAPTLDDDNLIRLDSRVKSAPGVSDNTKSPIILDGRHPIVRLLILHHHIQAKHAFNEHVLNELRQSYWILRARNTIRSVANACLHCRRWKSQLIKPPTGDLPPERLDHHKRPFTHVGLDYFGPITVTIFRRHEKRYVALYTCLVTRALHLEVVTSLSSDAAIMSLRRFIARRGSPSTIFSDNGTNFVGASRELRSLHNESVEEFATNHKIEWRFIPPASPFMGGAWERLVRSVKTALRASLNDKSLKEEVLSTLLLEAEAIINARPLTYVSSSYDSPEALTPFHFILGTSSVAPWTCTLTDADLVRKCDWRRVLRLADHFWTRWLREYLPTLRPRGPSSNAPTLGEGDVVLIADSTLPRGLWPLGRVVKVYPGRDGAVRVVDVHTRGGTLRRPARKLILLEAEPVTTGS